jgi:hypothetical protein
MVGVDVGQGQALKLVNNMMSNGPPPNFAGQHSPPRLGAKNSTITHNLLVLHRAPPSLGCSAKGFRKTRDATGGTKMKAILASAVAVLSTQVARAEESKAAGCRLVE